MNHLTITGFSCSNKRRLRKKIEKYSIALSGPVHIEGLPPVFYKRQHSLWYGGDTVLISYRKWRFILNACGDVYADLYDRESGDLLVYVKDKNNTGLFGSEIQAYIKTDKSLYVALNGAHTRYKLILDHNNWWEGFAIDPDGNFLDLMWCLDSDCLFDAVVEVLQEMDGVIRGHN